jgi:hypothetical protein
MVLTEERSLIRVARQREVGFMASAEDYRLYAQHCLRWADQAANVADREIFFEMANVWTQLELSAGSSVSNGQASSPFGFHGRATEGTP